MTNYHTDLELRRHYLASGNLCRPAGFEAEKQEDIATKEVLREYLQRFRCPNAVPTTGEWGDLESDEIAFFPPFLGWKCKKNCPLCNGGGYA